LVRAKPLLIALVVLVVAAGGVAVGRTWGQHNGTATSTSTSITVAPPRAIWPTASSGPRFTDPVTAALSFASNYLGFTDPLAGSSVGSTAEIVTVPIQPNAGALVTTVTLEVSTGPTWWVISASTPTIVVTHPTSSASVASPLAISGRSTAFEGVLNVDVRQDVSLASLARVNVMGGSMGVMGPFRASIHFATPTTSSGAVMFRVRSAKDGGYVGATVVPVTFA